MVELKCIRSFSIKLSKSILRNAFFVFSYLDGQFCVTFGPNCSTQHMKKTILAALAAFSLSVT
ncbi:MAG: hypothetical protein ABL870_07285, partial [Sediminibacterium sp.]